MTHTIRHTAYMALAAVFCLGVSAPALAAQQAATSDTAFLKKIAAHQQSEIQLSEWAVQRSASEQIKQFAQRMIQDHSKAMQEVSRLLSAQAPGAPAVRPDGTKQHKNPLASLSGSAFDRAYLTHQIADHKKAVSEFAAQSKTLKNPQVRQWVFATLPVLKEHLSLAKGLAAKPANRAAAQ